MQTNYNRTNNFRSVILAILLSLTSLGGLSLLFFNTTTSLPSWKINYFGMSRISLQAVLQIPLTNQAERARLLISYGLRIFQKILILSLNDSINLNLNQTAQQPVSFNQTAAAPNMIQAPTVTPVITTAPIQRAQPPKLLFTSSDQERINSQLYIKLQNIFQGAVHLDSHLRQSQRFNVIYDHSGHILLATVTVHHRTFQAIRYTDSKGHTGYYSPSGQALFKSMFLKAPVKYSRISDGYTLHRWHPILHISRPHYGIDYAAPVGTPIRAIGSGRISFAGWGGGYGNAIIIQHNNRYKSLYAHLSHFSAAVKAGEWVSQGQIIGFVGSTGLATGPHLHFGLYQYGKPINPLKVLPKFNPPTSVAQEDLPDFLAKTNQLLTQLAYAQNRNLANG